MGKSEEEIREFVDKELDSADRDLENETYLDEKVFKEEIGELDMRWKKCTKMQGNRRVMMPGNRSVKEEAILEMRQEQWMKIVKDYIKNECDEKGRPKTGQLPDNLQRGRIKLAKSRQEGTSRPTGRQRERGSCYASRYV